MTSPSYSIWIVTPPHLAHVREMFSEVAQSLQAAFAELGHSVPIVTEPEQVEGCAVVLAPQLLPAIARKLPGRMILYNLEQVHKSSQWFTPPYILMLRRFPVWDYSAQNIGQLKSYGVNHARLCGVGYMPVLSRIAPADEDIDVLFYGTVNPRRRAVLDAIERDGAKVVTATHSYGAERDALIARAKIVLNMHYHESQVFEIVRVSYLLANRKCVVSETGFDQSLEAPLAPGIAFAGYGNLAATCRRLLQEPQERAALGQKGFECFRSLSQTDMLRQALDSLPEPATAQAT